MFRNNQSLTHFHIVITNSSETGHVPVQQRDDRPDIHIYSGIWHAIGTQCPDGNISEFPADRVDCRTGRSKRSPIRRVP